MISSGEELNIPVSPMDPVYNCFQQMNEYMCDTQRKVTKFFKVVKDIVELIVVIIPNENHSQFYGK